MKTSTLKLAAWLLKLDIGQFVQDNYISIIVGILALGFGLALLLVLSKREEERDYEKKIQDALEDAEFARWELARANERIMALEDNFESLYDVALNSGHYDVFIKGKIYDEEVRNKLLKKEEFFKDLEKNVDTVVYPEDRDGVRALMKREVIREVLSESTSIDHYYRVLTSKGPVWMRLRIAYKNAEKENVIIGIFNAEAEIAMKNQAEATRKELIAKMSVGVSAYIVNPTTKRFQIIAQNEHLAANYTAMEDYDTSISRYIDTDVFEPDRMAAKTALSFSSLVSHLERNAEYSFQYRDISTGVPRWYEMHAVKLSDAEILYGFADKDDSISRRMLYDKMEDNYFALFYVNVDADLMMTVKDALAELSKEVGEVEPYEETVQKLAAKYEGETRAFFNKISNVDYIKTRFEKEDRAFYTYKSTLEDGKHWVNLTMMVLARHEDGTPSLFALGFSILDDEASEKEEAQLRLKESMEVVGALADAYTVLYHVDLDTGKYAPYHMSEQVGDVKAFIARFPNFVDFAKMYIESGLVHPEDREGLRSFYSLEEDIKNELRGKKRMSMLFRRNYGGEYLWTEINVVKCEDVDEEPHSAVVGFIEKDQEIRMRAEYFKEMEESDRLIQNIAANYNLAYTVNLADDSYKMIRVDNDIVSTEERFENFTQAKEYFFTKVLHPADEERMRREMDYDNIREKLAEKKTFSIEYRALIQNVTIWHEMIITALAADTVAIGFTHRDLDIIKKHIEEKRFEEYLALFEVDLDTAMVKPAKTSPLFKTAEAGKAMPYEAAMRAYADIYEGEVKEFFTRISSIEYLKREFAIEDKRTFSFKSAKLGEGKWIEVTSYIIRRHEDGTPSMLTLSFSMADAFATLRQEIQSKLTEDMQMIGGLASGYDTLYYVNIDEGLLKVYSHDGAEIPEIRQFINDRNVFEILYEYGKSDLVHPDDRELFEKLSAEEIRRRLKNSKKFTLRFRRLTGDDYFWCEMDVIKYEDIDEEANVIAVGFANRDAEIRSEQAMSRCFGVLNEDKTPQDAIEELLSIAGDFYGAERCYIFEYAKNGEVINNTFEWCAPGVTAMISQLQGIPASEVEGWEKEFKHQGAFHMDTLDTSGSYGSKEGRAILEMQGIESLVAAPIQNRDELVGFIGVDNPTKAKTNAAILKNIAVVAYSEILKRKENDEEHVTLTKLTDTFLSVYYADIARDYLHNWKIDEAYKEYYGKVEYYSVSMGGYVRENIAERDRERCIEMTSPTYILEQFKTRDRFSVEMTDIVLGYERSIVVDYVKVNEEGNEFVMCFRDVTETLEQEKERQNELEKAWSAAETASRSKTSFLFNMSHDIRTPMNAITGFTTMAKKYAGDKDKVTDYLDKIDTSGQQLLSLINQVLEMARIESGKMELEEVPVNVREEYTAMVAVLAEQAKANGLEFRHSLLNNVHNNVLADRARMSSITLNITGNAMKYTPSGGRVDFILKEIPARREGFATYTLTVADTGIGMSEEYQKVLFEPFTREKNSTVSKVQGTGLGMSIVKDLVNFLGGEIKVRTKLGEGTCFEVTIDFRIDEESEAVFEKQAGNATDVLKGRRVLLVEDNEMNREIAADILSDEGLVVEEAGDGSAAVEKLKAKGPSYYDFILMDIQMPIMNGYEATKEIRAMYPDARIPIIALSANAFVEDRAASLAAGMDDHVAKPININTLLNSLERFFR